MDTIATQTEPSRDWEQIAPLLDDAMAQLRERDRDALVLRYFQNKSLKEVGVALGLEERAAQKRVARGLEKLRAIFTKRGIVLSTAVIEGAVSANSVQAAPAALVATITATAAAKGISVSAPIITLVKGTMKTMMWLKIKFAAEVSVTLLLAGGAATVAISQTGGGGIASKPVNANAPIALFQQSIHKDYHLVQTYIVDSGAAPVGAGKQAVYVFVPPDNSSRAVVFQTFDSKDMEAWLSGLPRGSIVHYDGNGFMPRVPSAQLDALKTACQKKGVSFIESMVN